MNEEESLPVGRLRQKLNAVTLFMASPAYSDFLHTVTRDIANAEGTILARKPVSIEDIAAVNEAHGVRDILTDYLKFFEDSRSTLEKLIDEKLDDETKAALAKNQTE